MRIINGDTLLERVQKLKNNDLGCDDLVNQVLDMIREEPELALDEPYYGELVYQVTIPIEPKTKKNNQKIMKNYKTGKTFIGQSDAYRQYEKSSLWFLKPLNIDYPVIVKCLFYRKDKHRVDITNLLSAVSDVLVKKHTIKDDSFDIVVGNDGSRVLVDSKNPRTEIYIYKVKE